MGPGGARREARRRGCAYVNQSALCNSAASAECLLPLQAVPHLPETKQNIHDGSPAGCRRSSRRSTWRGASGPEGRGSTRRWPCPTPVRSRGEAVKGACVSLVWRTSLDQSTAEQNLAATGCLARHGGRNPTHGAAASLCGAPARCGRRRRWPGSGHRETMQHLQGGGSSNAPVLLAANRKLRCISIAN